MSDVEETIGEVCDSCGRSYEITYRVPDDIWLKIAPKPEAMGDHPEHALGGLLCPDCAASRAKGLGVNLRFNADTDWPDTSPVCVEVRGLGWRLDLLSNGASDIYLASGLGFRFLYGVQKSGPRENPWRAWDVDWEITGETFHPTLEAAQAACQADFERRTLELVNARSVADVRAELLAEMMADATNRAADTNGRPGAGSLNEMYCHAMDYIKAFRRALTEGEG